MQLHNRCHSLKALFFITLAVALLFSIVGKSQSLEERLEKTAPLCTEVFANAMKLLPELNASGQYDSIGIIIRILEKHCRKTLESRASRYIKFRKLEKKMSFPEESQASYYPVYDGLGQQLAS